VTVTSARQWAARHLEVVGLVVLVVVTFVLPRSTPLGIYAVGLVGGAALALQATGLVLVYRANRVVNFAQVEIGAVGGLLFVELARRQTFLVGLHYLCPSCMAVARVHPLGSQYYSVPVHPAGWLVGLNYWLAMLSGFAVVVLLSWLSHALVLRRFAAAPRLIVTVVTIGLSQVYVLGQGLIGRAFGAAAGVAGSAPLPFHAHVRVGGVVFGSTDIATLVVAVAATGGLAVFLRRSATGVLLRAVADNPRRADTLGVDVASVSSVAWIFAGAVSAVAAILAGTSLGVTTSSDETLVRILAAAVIGGMVSLPVTALAAVGISIFGQSILWVYSSPELVDGLLAAVIVAILLLQRGRRARVDTDTEPGWRATWETRPTPRELWALEVVRRWTRYLQAGGALALLGLPWILSPAQASLATDALIDGILGLSLLVLTGWAGQISLGQVGLAAVGAWVAAASRLPFLPAVLVAGLSGAAAAVVVGVPALRLRGLHLAITTLAFALAADQILLDRRYLGRFLPESVGRPAFLGVNLADERSFFYMVLAFLAVTVVAVRGLRQSRTGRALIASRDNDALAQSFGISLVRLRLSAFALSGAMAAVGGALFAYTQYGVQAENFSVAQSINVFLITVIGGLGSITAPLVGAAYYGTVTILSANSLFALAASGIGVVIVLLFVPGGLGDLGFRIRDAMLRRVASRYRIHVPSLVADGQDGTDGRAAIAPKLRPGGGQAFVPARYRLEDQWALEAQRALASHD
jgi:branched-chain amino acid transport system permease protein